MSLLPTYILYGNTSSILCIYFTDNEDLLGRTTLIGIVLAFRKLTLEALHNVSLVPTCTLCVIKFTVFTG